MKKEREKCWFLSPRKKIPEETQGEYNYMYKDKKHVYKKVNEKNKDVSIAFMPDKFHQKACAARDDSKLSSTVK